MDKLLKKMKNQPPGEGAGPLPAELATLFQPLAYNATAEPNMAYTAILAFVHSKAALDQVAALALESLAPKLNFGLPIPRNLQPLLPTSIAIRAGIFWCKRLWRCSCH